MKQREMIRTVVVTWPQGDEINTFNIVIGASLADLLAIWSPFHCAI